MLRPARCKQTILISIVSHYTTRLNRIAEKFKIDQRIALQVLLVGAKMRNSKQTMQKGDRKTEQKCGMPDSTVKLT